MYSQYNTRVKFLVAVMPSPAQPTFQNACRNSDIWRNFPRFMVAIFNLVYLSNKQGCQTSVAGAVCDWQDVKFRPTGSNVAYLQPYYQYFSSSKPDEPIFPVFEMLGLFGGPLQAAARLPTEDCGKQAALALVSSVCVTDL